MCLKLYIAYSPDHKIVGDWTGGEVELKQYFSSLRQEPYQSLEFLSPTKT